MKNSILHQKKWSRGTLAAIGSNGTPAARLAGRAALAAAAIALAGLERLMPPFFPAMPGVKIGLANLATLAALYWLGPASAALVAATRILVSAFVFGAVSALPYALCGGLLAWAAMCVARRVFGMPGVSMLGAVAHNIGQVCVAVWMLDSRVLFRYLPALTMVGCFTGFALGFVMLNLDKHIKPL